MKTFTFTHVSRALLVGIIGVASAEQAAQPRRDVFYVGGKYTKVTVSQRTDDEHKS